MKKAVKQASVLSSCSIASLGALAYTVLISGCALGPAYQKPVAETPPSWQPDAPWREALPNDAALKGRWWEAFNDPQLDRLAEQALAQNQSLKLAMARLDQARAQLSIVSSALLPQLGVSAGAGRVKTSADRPVTNSTTPAVSTVQNDYRLGVSVSYEADLFGRVRSDVAAARASAEQAAADFENTRLMLIAELATDYFNLRELDSEIDVLERGLGLQHSALDFINTRHELGTVSGLDIAQQQALLDSSTTQIELLHNQRAQFEHALATLTGTPAPGFSLAPEITVPTPPLIPIGMPSDVLERRPDVAAAERAMAAANARIGVARAAYFPSITLAPGAGWESARFSTLFNASSILWSLGISATQTLFDSGKARSAVDFAEAGYAGTVASYRQTVLTAMQEVENGITGLGFLARAATQAEASARSYQRVLDLANDRYSGGLVTYLDVITAQQSLLTSQRQTVQIRGQQLLTSVYLIKALGGGWSRQRSQL